MGVVRKLQQQCTLGLCTVCSVCVGGHQLLTEILAILPAVTC